MSHTAHFTATDAVMTHLQGVVNTVVDPVLLGQYTGFAAVSAVTVYELAISTIFMEFADKKHTVFGSVVRAQFDRINGRIKLKNIRDEYLSAFGEKYLKRFNRLLAKEEKQQLAASGVSISSSYGNLIVWRHEFAHEGRVPTNATFAEVARAYSAGKHVLSCLATAMVR